MTVGGGSGREVAPQMNVTPLVDVVLVLLIIFMVITPLLSKNFWVHLPKQEKEEVPRDQVQDPTPPLVLHVGAGRTLQLNGTQVTFEELGERLKRMFAARDDHVLFFDAADDAEYGFAVEVMDQARAGGAVTIATLTNALETPSGTPAP
jgi:biopolymer transport protein ExbD/biopolymer transport protein TolR